MERYLNSFLKIVYPVLHFSTYPFLWFLRFLRFPKKRRTVAYFCNFPEENAGYQYRAKKWANVLKNEGFSVRILTVTNSKERYNRIISLPSNHLWITLSLLKKIFHIVLTLRTETIIVRRELLMFNEYGNLFLDKLLIQLHPNAILDFDDDLAASKNQPKEVATWYGKLLLENGNKFNDSLRLYQQFIVASNYLKQKVLVENPTLSEDSIVVIPTCVDYDSQDPKKFDSMDTLRFGWIGGSYNLILLNELIEPLNKLTENYLFEVIVISGENWEPDGALFSIKNKKWRLETEIEDLLKIDVGLMPLNDSLYNKGKGGFKLIQYMGMGIPSVASGLTINTEIIDHQLNGIIVNDSDEWYLSLKYMLDNKAIIPQMGIAARDKIMNYYTFNSNKGEYVVFLNKRIYSND